MNPKMIIRRLHRVAEFINLQRRSGAENKLESAQQGETNLSALRTTTTPLSIISQNILQEYVYGKQCGHKTCSFPLSF
jgi:hypothetical protein